MKQLHIDYPPESTEAEQIAMLITGILAEVNVRPRKPRRKAKDVRKANQNYEYNRKQKDRQKKNKGRKAVWRP